MTARRDVACRVIVPLGIYRRFGRGSIQKRAGRANQQLVLKVVNTGMEVGMDKAVMPARRPGPDGSQVPWKRLQRGQQPALKALVNAEWSVPSPFLSSGRAR
jgi:hypothetical protein